MRRIESGRASVSLPAYERPGTPVSEVAGHTCISSSSSISNSFRDMHEKEKKTTLGTTRT